MFLYSINTISAAVRSDSLYLKSYPKKYSVRLLSGIKELAFAISNSASVVNSNAKVIYKPNNSLIGGVGVSYKNILIGYYFNVPGTDLNNEKFGKTSISDYQLNLTLSFLYVSGFHRTYKGFYVSRPYNSYPDWEGGMPYPQRQDIKYTTRGVETIINLNPHRYSLNASLKLTEQQLQSVFSTLVYLNYSYISISADSSLIPTHLQYMFFDGKELYQTNFNGWTVMPGLSYSLVKNKWFMNPMIFTGLGYLHKELLYANDGSSKYHDYYFRLGGRLNCGYNSRVFFAGAFVEWNEMFLPEKSLMIKTEAFNTMLMVGIRF